MGKLVFAIPWNSQLYVNPLPDWLVRVMMPTNVWPGLTRTGEVWNAEPPCPSAYQLATDQ
jgi:hypothetical protein